MKKFTVVEVCAGAGGQSLGLHKAGFVHKLAVEIDATAAETLRANLGAPVAVGDAASLEVWDPADYEDIDLFAGGVPCPPFSIAGKQLGSSDERDLFAWAVEQVGVMRPRAVMLENVRGLSGPRFSAYRQRILDRLFDFGYVGEWKLITSADFGVPQLRPRFVLIAMRAVDMRHFYWPEPTVAEHRSVGEALYDLMAAEKWPYASEWRDLASGVGPTLVGGSKKHGGADLGPTRAKASWAKLFVDGRGITDRAPGPDSPSPRDEAPRLTIAMAARIQGWNESDKWIFAGKKTSQYRQVGNAFPPPVAEALGRSIAAALNRETAARKVQEGMDLQDPVYRALSRASGAISFEELLRAVSSEGRATVEQSLAAIRHDFEVTESTDDSGAVLYRMGEFKGFIGQEVHQRHVYVSTQRNRVS